MNNITCFTDEISRGFGALSTGLQLQMVVASGSRFLPARLRRDYRHG